MVVGPLYLIPFIEKSGIEYKVYILIYQPHYVTMDNLCRITLRLTGDGFNAHLIYLMCRQRR